MLRQLIETVKKNPNLPAAGMILCHNGIVRQTSRDGRPVAGLKVTVDNAILDSIVAGCRRQPGIVDVQVVIHSDRYLAVGEDVMALVIAGDVRERVIAAMAEVLDAIKTRATRKVEFFLDH